MFIYFICKSCIANVTNISEKESDQPDLSSLILSGEGYSEPKSNIEHNNLALSVKLTRRLYFFPLSLLPLELGGADGPVGGVAESEPRLSHTPSLLENALSQENPGAGGGSSDGSVSLTPWPAAPDITRETRNSLRDNGLGEW